MERGSKQFFTLIELLVVIAIIAILAGMLLPALNNARESGRSADCMNKQKQISSAILQYAGDNNEYALPMYTGTQGGGHWFKKGMIGNYLGAWIWGDVTSEKPNGEGMFFCASDKTPVSKRKTNVDEYAMMWENGSPISIGLNRYISKHASWGLDIWVKINKFRQASGSYMGGDSMGYATCQNASVGSTYAQYVGDGSWHYWRINFRHNGERANGMWWDGHVSSFRYADIADKSNPNSGSSTDMKYVTFWKGAN